MKSVLNLCIRGSRLHYSGDRIQAEQVEIIQIMLIVKLVEILGKKREYLKGKVDVLETNSKKRILGTSIEAYMNFRRVTNLELT
jgi:hypothetical protein